MHSPANSYAGAGGGHPAHFGKDLLRTAPQTALRGHELRAADRAAQPRKRVRRWAERPPTSARSTTGPTCPCRPGFAITAYGYQLFLDYNELTDLIAAQAQEPRHQRHRRAHGGQPGDPEPDHRCRPAGRSRELHPAGRPRPEARRSRRTSSSSVRSSATSEDTEASFAGQHATVLNVSEANLIEAYKEVVASTFSPRAIYYRRRRGYRDQDVNMSVACIVMIHAKVSGVMYTVDPNDSRHSVIMISAVWGLAADAVEGSAGHRFLPGSQENPRAREPPKSAAEKERRLQAGRGGRRAGGSLPPKTCSARPASGRGAPAAGRLGREAGDAITGMPWTLSGRSTRRASSTSCRRAR